MTSNKESHKFKVFYFCDVFGNYVKFKVGDHQALTDHELLVIKAHLPSITVCENVGTGKTCIMSIEFYPSSIQRIETRGKFIRISDKLKSEIPLYVFHLMYSVFHKKWLRDGIYSVHAACLSRNKHTILLVGHSGFGKTSISLRLLKQYGFKLVTSDRTLLKINKHGELVPVGGTEVITYKSKDLNLDVYSDIFVSGTSYVDRKIKKIFPTHVFDGIPKKVDFISFVRLSDFNKDSNHLDTFEAIVSLYPYFLDYWNSDALIFEGLELYNGTDFDIKTKQTALLNLRKVVLKSSIISISGALEYITKEIDALVK